MVQNISILILMLSLTLTRRKIAYPIGFSLGSFGNIMTIIIMIRLRSKKKVYPLDDFFLVIAISDLLHIINDQLNGVLLYYSPMGKYTFQYHTVSRFTCGISRFFKVRVFICLLKSVHGPEGLQLN